MPALPRAVTNCILFLVLDVQMQSMREPPGHPGRGDGGPARQRQRTFTVWTLDLEILTVPLSIILPESEQQVAPPPLKRDAAPVTLAPLAIPVQSAVLVSPPQALPLPPLTPSFRAV